MDKIDHTYFHFIAGVEDVDNMSLMCARRVLIEAAQYYHDPCNDSLDEQWTVCEVAQHSESVMGALTTYMKVWPSLGIDNAPGLDHAEEVYLGEMKRLHVQHWPEDDET